MGFAKRQIFQHLMREATLQGTNNPVIEEIVHQLRLVVYPLIYDGFYGFIYTMMVVWDLFHQQYPTFWEGKPRSHIPRRWISFWRSWRVDLLKKLLAKHFAKKSCEPFVLFFWSPFQKILDRGHRITRFAGDQAMQMYVHFERFTCNSALFGLVVSWLPVGGLISRALLVSGSVISQNHPPRFPTRFLKPCENRGGLFFIGYDCMVGDPQKSRYLSRSGVWSLVGWPIPQYPCMVFVAYIYHGN